MCDAEVSFVLEAVKMVATEGWKLLPQYILCPEVGEWKHRTNPVNRLEFPAEYRIVRQIVETNGMFVGLS